MNGAPPDPSPRYEILVGAVLDSRWSAWFEGLQVTSADPGQSMIAGTVRDEAPCMACSPRSGTSTCR